MSNFDDMRHNVFDKIMIFSKRAGRLGHRVRHLVFGFRLRSTAHSDRWSLPVKLLHDHRLLQRRRVFQKSGGHRSSIAQHALKKARHSKQHP